MDMSRTIAPKSDQLNADDLITGPRVILITAVKGMQDEAQPVAVSFEGDNGKPYKPCKSMRRVMVHCWGKDAQQYPGRSMTLFLDPTVTFGGMNVGGIRISHMSHIDGRKTMALTSSKARRSPYSVDVLEVQAAPETSPADIRDYLRNGLNKQTTSDALENVWEHADFVKKFDALPEPMQNEIKAVYTENRTKLGEGQ